MSAAAGGALFIVQLQQTGLTGSPGSHGAAHDGQIETGLADGLVSGGHQERGGDHQDQGNDRGQDVVIEVLRGKFLLEVFCYMWVVLGSFVFVRI